MQYPKYHDDDEDNDDDDEDAVEEEEVQVNKYVCIISVPGEILFLSPAPKGGYPLRLTLCPDSHKQVVRKMTSFGLSLPLGISRRRTNREV